MELLMENKAKVMDNYLCNLKLTVSKTRLKMLCHVALICTIYCMTDMIYAVVCKEINVVRFRGSFYLCLFLNYVKQTTKSNLEKKLLSNSEAGFPRKCKIHTTSVTIYLLYPFDARCQQNIKYT